VNILFGKILRTFRLAVRNNISTNTSYGDNREAIARIPLCEETVAALPLRRIPRIEQNSKKNVILIPII
jgi:hypothetical protein